MGAPPANERLAYQRSLSSATPLSPSSGRAALGSGRLTHHTSSPAMRFGEPQHQVGRAFQGLGIQPDPTKKNMWFAIYAYEAQGEKIFCILLIASCSEVIFISPRSLASCAMLQGKLAHICTFCGVILPISFCEALTFEETEE